MHSIPAIFGHEYVFCVLREGLWASLAEAAAAFDKRVFA